MLEGVNGVRPPGFDGPKGARDRGDAPAPGKSDKPDKVELSSAGLLLARLRAMPEIRAEKVEEIRTQILRGTYVTDEKVGAATDSLVDDFLTGL